MSIYNMQSLHKLVNLLLQCAGSVLRHRFVGVLVIQQSLHLDVVVLSIHHYRCSSLVHMILLPSITHLFKQFNSVELHQTHEIFCYDPRYLNFSLVQAVRLGFKYPKLMKYSRSYDPSSLHYSVGQTVQLG